MTFEAETDEYCMVFRSSVDPKVWMCNVPYLDVADGLQASTSLQRIKAYVEEMAALHLEFDGGRWVKDGDAWRYYATGEQAAG